MSDIQVQPLGLEDFSHRIAGATLYSQLLAHKLASGRQLTANIISEMLITTMDEYIQWELNQRRPALLGKIDPTI